MYGKFRSVVGKPVHVNPTYGYFWSSLLNIKRNPTTDFWIYFFKRALTLSNFYLILPFDNAILI